MAYLEFDQETMTGETTLEPYDPTKPVYLSWITYDGSRESIELEFEDGVATAVIEYESDEEGLLEYTVNVYEPTEPSIGIGFYLQGQDIEVGDPIWFNEDGEGEYWLPYTYDREKPVTVSAIHLDGSYTTHDIVWDEDGTGTAKIISEVNGEEKIFTLTVYVSEISSETGIDAYLNAYNADGNIIDLYIDSDEAASEDEYTVTITYGSEEAYLYMYTLSEWAAIKTSDGDVYEGGEGMEVMVSDGDVVEFKVIAQDGSEQEYRLAFVESDGTSTAIKMYADMGMAGDMVDFVKRDGKMVADIEAPYWFDNEEGLYLDWISDEFVSADYDDEEPIYLEADGTQTVEFTVTSANGENTQDYVVNITQDQDCSNTELKYIDVYYRDNNGKLYTINATLDEAASENGATVVLPENADIEGCYVDVEIKTLKYARITDLEFESAHNVGGYGDYDMEGFTIDLAEVDPSVITFSVLSANEENTQDYKLTIKTFEEEVVCDHEGSIVIDEAVEGTCTEPGLTEGSHCSECGEIITAQIPVVVPHDMGEWTVTKIATAAEPGAKTASCTVCGVTVTEEIPCDENVLAAGGCGEGLTWIFNANGTLVISGTGAMDDYSADENGVSTAPWAAYKDDIKALIIEDGVTSIGEYAFANVYTNESLMMFNFARTFNGAAATAEGVEGELAIPASVKSIGKCAFAGCDKFEGELQLPANLETIGDDAFNGCAGLEGEVKVPATVTEVGDRAFQNCGGIDRLTVPNKDCTLGADCVDPEGVTIAAPEGSKAEQYAQENNIPSEPLANVVFGDANGDSKINVKDAAMVLQYANGKLAADKLDLTASDVTGDGKVNVKDAAMVLQYANGKLTSFPAAQ
jgi:hypothetical protein